MPFLLSIVFAALLPTAGVKSLPANARDLPVISCAAAKELIDTSMGKRVFFRLHGQIVAANGNHFFVLDDGNQRALVTVSCDDSFSRGDTVTVLCTTLQHNLRPNVHTEALALRIEGHAELPPPPAVRPAGLSDPKCVFSQIELQGIVTDVFRDEVAPSWLVLALSDGGVTVHAWHSCNAEDEDKIFGLLDAEVSLRGIWFPYTAGSRSNFGPHLQTTGRDAILTRRPTPEDPFSANGGIGHRQIYTGTVAASWGTRSLFLNATTGEKLEVILAPGQPTPAPGATVTVAAFVQHNAFFKRLTNARVRLDRANGAAPNGDDIPLVSAQSILRDKQGRLQIETSWHGQLVRLRGMLRDGHLLGTSQAQILLDCGGEPVSVWIGSGTTAPEPTSFVEVIGACIINAETGLGGWNDVRLNGFSIALRRPSELKVLANPPWWTPFRLIVTIFVLLAVLTAIMIWNRSLRIIAERRGRELLRTAIGKVEAELRTEERTRLAVELHDTIAQSLTGVTFELNAADRFIDTTTEKAHQHLAQADRALKSCRDELRNCIWDLRGNALDRKDMNDAIRQALMPHIGQAKLIIRFNVPRTKLTDNAAHTLLRIIRELTINAVRHGHATTIRIAGEQTNGLLSFSVRDDGTGFDPQSAPGVQQGHFGLQGIRERVNQFSGEMRIESRTDCGTKVTISIKMPENRESKDGRYG